MTAIVPPSMQSGRAPAEDPSALQRVLDGEHAWARDEVRRISQQPEFERPSPSATTAEHREMVAGWTKQIADMGHTARGYPQAYGGENDVGGWITAFESLAHTDLSLLVKAGVQFGLFGGAVLHLGTEKHHERHLRAIARLKLPGCFAMTETGHGSNVQALRTTATYDAETEEFVVHTPDDDARKDYIGGAARDGRIAAVFAQLIVGGESRGVHALLVPLRDDDGG